MSVGKLKFDILGINVVVVDEIFSSVQSTMNLTPVTDVDFVDGVKLWLLRIRISELALGLLWNIWTIAVLIIIRETIEIKINLSGHSLRLSLGIGQCHGIVVTTNKVLEGTLLSWTELEHKSFLSEVVPFETQIHGGHVVTGHLHGKSVVVVLGVHVPRMDVEELVLQDHHQLQTKFSLTEVNDLPWHESVSSFGIAHVLDLVVILPGGSVLPNKGTRLDSDHTVDIDGTFLNTVDGAVELVLTGDLQRSFDDFSLTVGDRSVKGELSGFLLGLVEGLKSQCNSIRLPVNLSEWDIVFLSVFEAVSSVDMALTSCDGHLRILS
jgi:hypothetical protein